MNDDAKTLTLEELNELNAYFGEHGELPQAPFWCDDDSWFGDVGDADLIRGWQPLPPSPSSEAK